MNYKQLIEHSRDQSSAMLEVAEKVQLKLLRTGSDVRIRVSGDPDCELVRLFIQRNFINRPAILQLDTYLRVKILQTGPKIFRPTDAQCLIGRETNLNLTLEGYNQPYPFMIIELPDTYAESRIIENAPQPITYRGTDILEKYSDKRKPGVVIVHYDPEIKLLLTSLNWEDMATNILYHAFDNLQDELSLFMDKGVNEIEREIRRVALNYCLLVDEYGAKRVGYDNVAHANRLARRAASGKNSMNGRLLRSMPVIYEIDQSIKLLKTVVKDSDLAPDPSGRVMPPHHRRGHYRMQAYGIGLTQRKRIRVPPVFVNSHLFLGKMDRSEVTYSTH